MSNITEIDQRKERFVFISLDHSKAMYVNELKVTIDDRDFCVFEHFPFKQLVFIQVAIPINRSCVLKWLTQYEKFYQEINGNNENRPSIFADCNFSRKIELCKKRPFKIDRTKRVNTLDFMIMFEFLNNIGKNCIDISFYT